MVRRWRHYNYLVCLGVRWKAVAGKIRVELHATDP